jgi:hypothetical protein
MKGCVVLAGLLALTLGGRADDFWEREPIRYSDARTHDSLTLLTEELEQGNIALKGETPLERMREVLALLKIPEASQVLVFSKTSKQNSLINPWNPRAIYFSSSAYAAYVPGGEMEIITHDPTLGPVFHLVDLGAPKKLPTVKRATADCLSCHGTSRTEDVPGVLVRSVFSDKDGQVLGGMGSVDVNAATPISQRWGGYYVTGRSSIPHLGNRQFSANAKTSTLDVGTELETLEGKIPLDQYPQATSDIVSLMVLEHQCQVHNLMTAASYRYRWSSWMALSLDPQANAADGAAGRIADDHAVGIVDALLFKDAASMGEGVEGSDEFQVSFLKQFPVTKDGHSLADFHLGQKLFKNRCSYMIYSPVFDSLPPRVSSAIVARLRKILEAQEDIEGYEYLGKTERDRIVSILKETWPRYRVAK